MLPSRTTFAHLAISASTNWPNCAGVFSRVSAAVSDVGGMMAHTAIISREYGLPAVVGVGFATATIKTGDVIEVDGDAGTIKILQRAGG